MVPLSKYSQNHIVHIEYQSQRDDFRPGILLTSHGTYIRW